MVGRSRATRRSCLAAERVPRGGRRRQVEGEGEADHSTGPDDEGEGERHGAPSETVCADSTLRCWTPGDEAHGGFHPGGVLGPSAPGTRPVLALAAQPGALFSDDAEGCIRRWADPMQCDGLLRRSSILPAAGS